MKKALRKARSSIRPSGWAFLTVAALVQLAAWNSGANLLYLIAGALIGFLLVSFVFCRWTLKRLSVFREAPASVYRGDPFAITVRAKNRGKRFPIVSLRLESLFPSGPTSAYVEKIPSRTSALIRLRALFPKRGVYALPPLTIRSAFPMGLFERRLVYDDGVEVVVYPRVRALRTGAFEQIRGFGETPRLKRGEDDEFFGLRDYIPGDDIRRIAWHVSARVGHPVVRELEPSTSRNVHIVFDTRGVPEMEDFEEQFEDAVDLVASLAVTCLNRYYSVAIVTPDAAVPLGEGSAHIDAVLNMLARLNPAFYPDHSDDWFGRDGPLPAAAYIFVSPDPAVWGRPSGFGGTRVLDPREVVHA